MTRQRLSIFDSIAIFISVLTLISATFMAAQTESVIHAFGTSNNDGALAWSGLVADASGALYGVTAVGGQHGAGAVYKLLPSTTQSGTWIERILYSFTGDSDGVWPKTDVLLDAKRHSIYGTTPQDGKGYGVVYELLALAAQGDSWTQTVLYTFSGGLDGGSPSSSVIEDKQGRLYGATASGGNTNGGVVYRLTPPASSGGAWTEEVLYNFYQSKSDGATPVASLIFDHTGALYGTTSGGGNAACSGGCGTVFKLNPPSTQSGSWTESILYGFNGSPNDGANPQASVVFDSAGALYGTTTFGGDDSDPGCTYDGCGIVFKLSPPSSSGGEWTEQVLHTFTGGNDGGGSSASLVLDPAGNLYGTTFAGTELGNGGVFKLARATSGSWTETILHSFAGRSDGIAPLDALLRRGGKFYGTTFGGGVSNAGTVFEVTP